MSKSNRGQPDLIALLRFAMVSLPFWFQGSLLKKPSEEIQFSSEENFFSLEENLISSEDNSFSSEEITKVQAGFLRPAGD